MKYQLRSHRLKRAGCLSILLQETASVRSCFGRDRRMEDDGVTGLLPPADVDTRVELYPEKLIRRLFDELYGQYRHR